MHTQIVDQIVISPLRAGSSHGLAAFASNYIPCLTGRTGIGVKRCEGDGMTPAGAWTMRYFLYRQDRISRPGSALPGFALQSDDEWCDEAFHRSYNQPVKTHARRNSEKLYRPDNLYDLIVVLDHNQAPAIKNRGSAIFVHLADKNTRFTQGCLAFSLNNLKKLLAVCGPRTKVVIRP